MNKLAQRVLLAGVAIGYFWLFDWCYELAIATHYGYYGFNPAESTFLDRAIFLIAALVPLAWLPLTNTRPSDVTTWLLYLFLVGPLGFLSPNLTEPWVRSLTLSAVFVAAHGVFEFLRRRPPIVVPATFSTSLLPLGLGLFTGVMTLFVLSLNGFEVDLSYDRMYERRVLARELLPGRTLADYAIATFSAAAVPLCILLGVTQRRLVLLLLGVGGLLAMFSLTGEKATIFSPLLILAVVFLVRVDRTVGIRLMIACLTLFAAAVIQAAYTDSYYLAEVFVRRKFAIPALLSFKYWEYFSQSEYLYFGNTLLGNFLWGGSTRGMEASFLIGEYYFASATNNAGTNIWATGFAHLGYAGLFLSSWLAALILRCFDGLATRGSRLEIAVVCALIGSSWSEGGIHTSLLSHGVLPMFALLYFMAPSTDLVGSSAEQQTVAVRPRRVLARSQRTESAS